MNKLDEAIELAKSYHHGQVDKGGAPYIHHLFSVMKGVKLEKEKIVAILHDILEDTSCPLSLVQLKFGDEIAQAVLAMTKIEGETYSSYIERVSENEIARAVKIADLKNNMDLSRIPNLTKEDYSRVEKYKKTLSKLERCRKSID
jgi:GTP diphosphokinase / guanosine-3',5'-bis(diphosphate) 3'-diphosphatase